MALPIAAAGDPRRRVADPIRSVVIGFCCNNNSRDFPAEVVGVDEEVDLGIVEASRRGEIISVGCTFEIGNKDDVLCWMALWPAPNPTTRRTPTLFSDCQLCWWTLDHQTRSHFPF